MPKDVNARNATLYRLKSKDLLMRQGYAIDDPHLTTREETEAFMAEHGVDTTPRTFIGGTDRRVRRVAGAL